MYKIKNNNLIKLIPLCREDDFITLSVLQGSCKGWALVDNIENPKSAAIFHAYGGCMSYLGDKPDKKMAKEVAQAVISYRSEREFVNWAEFANYPEDTVSYIEEEFKEVEHIERIYWDHDEDMFNKAQKPILSEGLSVVPIITSDLENESILESILLFWDKADNMLEKAFGIKAMHNDKVIGICTTVAHINGHNEIDIAVNSEYRKQGIGYAMAHAFITECYKRGEKPGWDCVSHNEPSKALAIKLGFKQVGKYKLLEWVYK